MATVTYDTTCFLCHSPAKARDTDYGNRRMYRCSTCGEYEISRTAMGRINDSLAFKAQASIAAAAVAAPDQIYEIIVEGQSFEVVGRVVRRRTELR